jgi:hypothetical protein
MCTCCPAKIPAAMSAILTIMFLAAGVLTAVMLAGLALVIAGIHGEERRMNLSAQPALALRSLPARS